MVCSPSLIELSRSHTDLDLGDCRIAVMNYDPGLGTRWDIEDFATWGNIRSSMGQVMIECVNEPRRQGGTEKTGE